MIEILDKQYKIVIKSSAVADLDEQVVGIVIIPPRSGRVRQYTLTLARFLSALESGSPVTFGIRETGGGRPRKT